MKITNYLFRTKRIHREIWKHAAPQQIQRTQTECLHLCDWLFKMVKSCRVFIGSSTRFDTDHRIVLMDVSFPKTKRQLKFKLSRAVTSTVREPSLRLQSLRSDPKLKKTLSEYLDTAVSGVNCNDMDELNEILTYSERGS